MKRNPLYVMTALLLGHQPILVAQEPIPEPAGGEITEIVSLGEYIPDEKRATAAISNVIDAEAFSRAGDSSVAEGLKRVSGLNLAGGRYIYVRGLGERYSNSMLNGAMLPSPEPIRRVVPLDLFPTSIIESVLVQKTFSAEYPAEFGGGTIQMRTKVVPEEDFFQISSTLGYNASTSFKDGLTYSGGDDDWRGVDDGTRDIPDLLKSAIENDQELRRSNPFTSGGFSPEDLEAIGESLTSNYTATTKEIKPDMGVGVSFGKQIFDGDWRYGALANAAYSNTWETRNITRNDYNATTVDGEVVLVQNDARDFMSTEHSVDTTLFLTAGAEYADAHSIKGTILQIRKMDDLAGHLTGTYVSDSAIIDQTRLEWIERDLLSYQIEGENVFFDLNELTLNWHYNESRAKREAPDMREYRYEYNINADAYLFSTRGDGNTREWSDLQDDNQDIALNAKAYFETPYNTFTEFRAGLMSVRKDRDSSIRRFTYLARGAEATDTDVLSRPTLDQIITPETISRRGFELVETTRTTDTYTASQELDAYYVEADVELSPSYRLLAGARWEDSVQNVSTFDLFDKTKSIDASLDTSNVFPVITGTWIIDNYGMQVRAGYSETISRPDFRELSPSPFTDPVTGYSIIGNPDLKAGYLKNYDLRWEWYFSADESISVGLFYKEFENPIEAIVETSASNRRTYINALEAENFGIEFDGFRWLGFVNESLESWYVSTNLTLIESEVTIRPQDRGVLTNTTRPLQGQADYIFNVQLGYDDFFRQKGSLVFHYTGDKIREVGVYGSPDILDGAYGELDFNYTYYFSDNLELGFKAKNLLDNAREATQGGFDVNTYREGRTYDLSASYKF